MQDYTFIQTLFKLQKTTLDTFKTVNGHRNKTDRRIFGQLKYRTRIYRGELQIL